MNSSTDPSIHPFVKTKLARISAEILPERPGEDARARKETRSALSKVLKKAASIGELLDEDDAHENIRVIREAKNAMHRVYSKEAGGLVEVPDHKARLAAVTLELAYREGLPVQRQVIANTGTDDSSGYMTRALRSPALRGQLRAMLDEATAEEAERGPKRDDCGKGS